MAAYKQHGGSRHWAGLGLFLLLLCNQQLWAQSISWFPELQPFPQSEEYNVVAPTETDYLLGLGALQKIGGRWRHKKSEHIAGELARYTWHIKGGYSAEEGVLWLRKQLPEDAELLYQCKGRTCGSSAQWANTVFKQRVLYGNDDRQHYIVFQVERDTANYYLVLYAADRANRNYYLHLDVLRHSQSP